MSTKKRRLKTVVAEIPTSLDEVDVAIGEIARIGNQIDEINVYLEKQILALQEEAAKKISPLSDSVKSKFAGIYAYCESNRDTLLPNGKKSIELSAGIISWRLNPSSVVFKSGMKAAEIIKILRKKRLSRFVRIKEEVNREAILENKYAVRNIPEISIVQQEVFSVKPNDLVSEVFDTSANLRDLVSPM